MIQYKFSLMVIAALALASQALATTVTINAYSGYRSGSGGEFNITSNDPLLNPISLGYSSAAIVSGGFETFCLEYNQHFTPGSTYNFGISGAAIGSSGADNISIATAWLYSQFAHNAWDAAYFNGANVYSYVAGAARQASAAALQNTIWWLENENYSFGSSPDPGNIFSTAVLAKFASVSGARADSNGAYGVSVLNLGNTPSFSYQDQLVLTTPPPAPAQVPDGGATLVLMGVALGALSLLKWRLA